MNDENSLEKLRELVSDLAIMWKGKDEGDFGHSNTVTVLDGNELYKVVLTLDTSTTRKFTIEKEQFDSRYLDWIDLHYIDWIESLKRLE